MTSGDRDCVHASMRTVACDEEPGSDENWEFYATKQPVAVDSIAGIEIGMAETTIDFGSLRFQVEEEVARRVVNVVVWHPGFSEIPEQAARHMTFIMIDNIIGEGNLETWLDRHLPDRTTPLH